MYSMNFLTCLNGSRAALKYMVDQEHGHLINIGSEAAVDGFPGAAAYLVSKSSVHMLTRLISLENKENNITAIVNSLRFLRFTHEVNKSERIAFRRPQLCILRRHFTIKWIAQA